MRAAEWLTLILINKGIIGEDEKELYMFGFQTGLEFMSCLFASLTFALLTDHVVEYLVFMLVFMPVRSYTGGFHFDSFLNCFLGSCALIVLVIWMADLKLLNISLTFAGIVVLLILIGKMRPVEHENRRVSEAEEAVFHNILLKVLCCVGVGAILFYVIESRKYLNLIFLTLLSVLISMLIGKVSQWKRKRGAE